MQEYRHEIKYICSYADLRIIYERIKSIMKIDGNAGSDGSYLVRSIYFDDYYNSAFYNNESGVDPREKWRIRIYNCNDKNINLECKRKKSGLIHKDSICLTPEQFKSLMSNQMKFDCDNSLLNRFLILKETHLLRPKVIVEYRRYPFIFEVGNVRVTFDCNISSSSDYDNFFSRKMVSRPILSTDMHLLEVKFDELLPDFIYQAIQLKHMEQFSFSKYYLCRKFNY